LSRSRDQSAAVPEVSVVIPVWNRAIAGASVESALAQRGVDFELIVVDDGSTDYRVAQLAETYARDPRFRMIRIEHRGPGAARNAGVAIANSALIAFLDSDDLWAPEKLEKQLRLMQQNPQYRISQCQEYWIREGVRVNPGRRHLKRAGDIFVESLRTCLVSPSTVIMERALFDEVGRFDEDFRAAEDYDLWLRILLDHQVALLDELLATRHGHKDQLSRTVVAIDRYRVLALMKLLRDERLRAERRAAVVEVLIEKIKIYAHGLRRRGRDAEANLNDQIARNAPRWAERPDSALAEAILNLRSHLRAATDP
jgi:glycosyltransferase involved in cell wall biosynthesis